MSGSAMRPNTSHYPATPKVKACSPRRAATEGGSLLTIVRWRRALFLLPLALCWVALSVLAVTPAPDGGYPNGNTAEGTNALFSLTTGINNTALGFNALYHNTTGYYNTATGTQALFTNTTGFKNTADGFRALYLNTTGYQNTASGLQSLFNNTTGFDNTAVGFDALFSNTTGDSNTATGYFALFNNTTGDRNTANGFQALFHNTTGDDNVANGYQGLFSNTTGSYNAANGDNALYSNTTGQNNAANGFEALYNNTTGDLNTANGGTALYNNTTGSNNTANGFRALFSNTTGGLNTANGYYALYRNTTGVSNAANGAYALFNNTTGDYNTADGYGALYNNTGPYNTALGGLAGYNLTNGSGNVDIGVFVYGVAGEGNTTRIRNIGSTAQNTGIYVTLDAVGGTKLGYVNLSSSRRHKEQIKPMDKASEALFALKPVNFRYKPEFDPDRAERFGLIAEDVEKINPDLVSYDSEGKPVTVRHESINAMLLNEFLKEHRKVQELEATVAEQHKGMEVLAAQLTARLEEQASQIQKVSAQLELSKPAPQTVLNNQ